MFSLARIHRSGSLCPPSGWAVATSNGDVHVHPTRLAAPGYRPFFVVALFFAMLHLGVLVISTGKPSPVMIIYLIGLLVALMALILG